MDAKYFTTEFIKKISSYISSLSKEEVETYVREGEEAIEIRAAGGLSHDMYLGLIENIGIYLKENSGNKFTSDYQEFSITPDIRLFSFELPGGGNLFVFLTPEGKMILDTGYGCFYEDCLKMVQNLGLGDFSDVKKVVCTHGDADHCGASGFFSVPALMHPVTKALLESGSRNYGSQNNLEILEKVYTTTINTISKMNIASDIDVCKTEELFLRGLFSVIDYLDFAGMHFEIWESLGGHIAGQIFLYEEKLGLLFTSDALFNFTSLSSTRANYCSIADSMVSSVNVNSEIGRIERKELTRIALEIDSQLQKDGRRLILACGHGAVSLINPDRKLSAASVSKHYAASDY